LKIGGNKIDDAVARAIAENLKTLTVLRILRNKLSQETETLLEQVFAGISSLD